MGIKKRQLQEIITDIMSVAVPAQTGFVTDKDEMGRPLQSMTSQDAYDEDGNPIMVSMAERLMASKLHYMDQNPGSYRLGELREFIEGRKVQVDANVHMTGESFFSEHVIDENGVVDVDATDKE